MMFGCAKTLARLKHSLECCAERKKKLVNKPGLPLFHVVVVVVVVEWGQVASLSGNKGLQHP